MFFPFSDHRMGIRSPSLGKRGLQVLSYFEKLTRC